MLDIKLNTYSIINWWSEIENDIAPAIEIVFYYKHNGRLISRRLAKLHTDNSFRFNIIFDQRNTQIIEFLLNHKWFKLVEKINRFTITTKEPYVLYEFKISKSGLLQLI